MNIDDYYKLISEVAVELPDKESRKLLEIRDSLEKLGPDEWLRSVSTFVDSLLAQNIGEPTRLYLLKDEAENVGSVEISGKFVLIVVLAVVLIALASINL